MSKSFGLTEKEMRKIKIRKLRDHDVSEIVSIQESILQKKVSKKSFGPEKADRQVLGDF